jgi:hypothetical protein
MALTVQISPNPKYFVHLQKLNLSTERGGEEGEERKEGDYW